MTAPVPSPAAPFVRQPITVDLVADGSAAEWEALHDRVIRCDRSARTRLVFTGAKAAEVLGGLVTNDVTKLAVGTGQYAAALTPKGKVISDLRIMRAAEEQLIVDADATGGAGLLAMIRKYVNPRLASYRDLTGSTHCIGLYGPRARAAVERLLERVHGVGIMHAAWLPYQVVIATVDGEPWWIVASPDIGVRGYDVILPSAHRARAEAALSDVPLASDALCEAARIVAGRPRWGADLDDGTIPQEARLEALGAISFDKGCYTGQEVVARLHFRGHVNRRLVLLSSAGHTPLPSGADVRSLEGTVVGDVRSSACVPPDRCVAIAMLRREIPDHAELLVNERACTVAPLAPSSS